MNIDPRNSTNHIYAKNSVSKPASAEATNAANPQNTDTIKLGALDKLRSEPEIRPEVVAKGKELLNDPNWPSQEIVESIAKLITPLDDVE